MGDRLWSYITGRKGVSRVRVYERYEGSPIHVEWYPNGKRRQRSLDSFTGEKIYDKRDAMRVADNMARELEQSHRADYQQRWWGITPKRTLGELFKQMHEARQRSWSDTYRKGQERRRTFWLEHLGDVALTSVTEPMVEGVLWDAKDDVSPATRNRYRRYLVDAFTYAQKKLKWITEPDNLSAVDFEDEKSDGKPYSLAETRALLNTGLPSVGPVPEWIGQVLWQTGRRLTATRTLPKSAVTVLEDHTLIDWPEETDKPGKGGQSVVVGRAHELSRQLMQEPGEYMAGREPPSLDTCIKVWIREAEDEAGVEYVKGRGWHGIKRRYSGATKGLKGRDKQSGTLESTLRQHYEPDDDVAAKAEVAKELARKVDAT